MRARHVQFKRIASGVLTALDDLVPGIAIVFLHDRGDENPLRVLVFDLLEFVDPGFKTAIGNQLDVLPTVNLAGLAASQPRVSGLNVDYFSGVQTNRFTNDGAPAFF